jgi:hypothetical protein
MNNYTINKELKYYTYKNRNGTAYYYKDRFLNWGSLTFSIYVFKDRAYKEHGKPDRNYRKTSKIPSTLFNRYKFGALKNVD